MGPVSLAMQGIVSGLLMGGIYSLVAVGLSLIFGVMGIINFAHGSLMMIAMYIAYWSATLLGLHPYLSFFLTIPVLFFMGVIIERYLISLVLSAEETIQILLTLGVALWIENVALALWRPDFRSVITAGKTNSFFFGDISFNLPKLYGFAFALACVVALAIFLKKTDVGLGISAAAQDKDAARLVGINVKKIYAVAFGIGTACVGAAGTLVMPFFYVYPEVGYMFVLNAFIIVVMGGMGNIVGAFFCGLIVGVTESLGGLYLAGDMKQAVVFVVFILTLLFRPQGLFTKKSHS